MLRAEALVEAPVSGAPVGAEPEQDGVNAETAEKWTGADPGLGHAPLAAASDAAAISPLRHAANAWVDFQAACYVSPIRNDGMA